MFVWNSFLIYRLQAITLQLFQMFFTLLKGIVQSCNEGCMQRWDIQALKRTIHSHDDR